MDAGWAAIFGAAIGVLATGVLPWVREATARRRERAEASRTEIRDALLVVMKTLTARAKALRAGDTALAADLGHDSINAIFRLAMSLPKADHAISDVATLVASRLGGSNDSVYLAAFDQVIPQWFAGFGTAVQAYERFEGTVKATLEARGAKPSS